MAPATARLLLLMVTIIWGSGYVVTDLVLGTINPYQLLTGRFLLTFIALSIVFFPQLKKINLAALKRGALLGIFLYGAFVLQTVGVIYTTPSKNAFLTATSVVIVPLISFLLFKQKVQLRTQVGIGMTVVGVALMSLNGFTGINIGDVLSLFCAMFFALQSVFLGKFVRETNPASLMIVQMGTASAIGLAVNFIRGDVYLGGQLNADLSVLYLALFNTLICYGIQSLAQQSITATESSLILSMESFWGMLFSALILKEAVTYKMVFGAMFILTGIFSAQGILDPKKLAFPFKGKRAEEQPKNSMYSRFES